jgi:hypothetical protein
MGDHQTSPWRATKPTTFDIQEGVWLWSGRRAMGVQRIAGTCFFPNKLVPLVLEDCFASDWVLVFDKYVTELFATFAIVDAVTMAARLRRDARNSVTRARATSRWNSAF